MENNTYDRIYSIINEIENTIPVDKWIINDVHIWPYLRRSLFLELYNSGVKIKTNKTPLLFNKFKACFSLVNPFFWYRLLRKYDVILCSDGISHLTMNGKSYDVFCSPLAQQLNEHKYNYITISPINSIFRNDGKKILSFDCFDTVATLITKISSHLFNKQEVIDYDNFLAILKKYNIDASRFRKEKLFTVSLRIYLLSKILYVLFKRMKPSIGFIVSYYSIFGYAFNIACRKLGVNSVDIQHGTQSNTCDAYNRWNNVPASGYPELPSIFWNWLQEDCDYIDIWAKKTQGHHQTYLGGHPWMSFWMHENETTAHYDELINNLKSQLNNENSTIDIIVTLQVGSVDHTTYWDQLLNIINNTNQMKIRWWIRKHPASLLHGSKEDRFIENIQNENINYVEASSYPLYALLRHMDLHITVESNTAIEAWLFGVKTLFLSNFAKESFHTLFRIGSGIVLNKNEDVINYLLTFNKSKHDKFDVVNKITEIDSFIKKYSNVEQLCRER